LPDYANASHTKFKWWQAQRAYSMRLSGHAGLQGAWNMRSGLARFEIVF
jgi:hypothetical protein